jgi:hypothetical protein
VQSERAIRRFLVTDAKTMQQEAEDQQEDSKSQGEQMCCEGGMTAAEHRAKSPDGKCCTD